MKGLTVLGIGGNAINAASYEEEERNILKCFHGIEKLIDSGPLIITHGNGPQVGKLLNLLKDPIGLCTSQTQGGIGSLLELSLRKYLERKKIKRTDFVGSFLTKSDFIFDFF